MESHKVSSSPSSPCSLSGELVISHSLGFFGSGDVFDEWSEDSCLFLLLLSI